MDRVEFALRRFSQIDSRGDRTLHNFPRRRFETWLKDDVRSAVEPYWLRPRFQEHATWPQRELVKGSNSNERKTVEAIDAALVAFAQMLLKLADHPRVRVQLHIDHPPSKVNTEETVEITARGTRTIERKQEAIDLLSMERNQVGEIAARLWTDLVSTDDYFHPAGSLFNRTQTSREQWGEFIPSLNPQLHVIGDFVTRCLLRRIEVHSRTLGSFLGKCQQTLRKVQVRFRTQVSRLLDAWEDLQRQKAHLESICLCGDEARRRDSCIILTQVYVAFHPTPECGWLNLRQDRIDNGRASIKAGLTSLHCREMIDRIAATLYDLRALYRGQTEQQTALEEAVAGGGLVLTSGPDAYWDRIRIDVEWERYRTAWKLLNALRGKPSVAGTFRNAILAKK